MFSGSCYTIEIPKIKASYVGTGDLFAALFLAWFYKTDCDLKISLEKTIATLQAIVKDTFEKARGMFIAHNKTIHCQAQGVST